MIIIGQAGEATLHAAMRADELLEAGDMEGRAAWLRILKAVKELQATEPPGSDQAVH